MRHALQTTQLVRRNLTTVAKGVSFNVPTLNYAEHMLNAIEVEASKFPLKAAIIDGLTGNTIIYGDYAYRVGAAARGFRNAGVSHGTVVAMHMTNSPEFVIAFTALASLGAIITTSNPHYTHQELTHQLKNSGATFILTMPLLKPLVATAIAAVGGLSPHAMFVLGEPSASFLTADVSISRHANRALPDIATVDALNHTLAMPYSSGTTGLPKGANLSHSNLTSNIVQSTNISGLIRTDVVIGVVPLYHI